MSNVVTVCDEKKRSGGKIVKVCVRICGDLIKGIMISGDFFVDPAENFEELLEELADMEVKKDEAITLVTKLLKNKKLDFSGISIEDITEVLSRILHHE